MPEIFGPTRLANAKNLRDRDDVMWEIDKAVEAWAQNMADMALALTYWKGSTERLRQRYDTLESDFNIMRQHLHDEIGILLERLEAADGRLFARACVALCDGLLQAEANEDRASRGEAMAYRGEEWPSLAGLRAALAAGETTHDDYGTTWAALAAGEGK